VRATEAFHAALLVGRGRRGRELTLVHVSGGRTRRLGRVGLGDGPAALAVEATASAFRFLGGTGESLQELGSVPTRSFSAETILRRTGRHHFTGATIGLVATGNGSRATVPADFLGFDYMVRQSAERRVAYQPS
jgi:hypothetical protein